MESECVYFGECLAFMLYVSKGLGTEIVVRGEPSFLYLKGFTEISSVRFFRFCDLVSPIARRKVVCDRLEHPPLILRSGCFFV